MRRLIEKSLSSAQNAGGYVSLEHGFLNPESPKTHFPEAFKKWDLLLQKMPECILNNTFKEAVAQLTILDATELPPEYLTRAAVVLNAFAKAYCFQENLKENLKENLNGLTLPTLPNQILMPWQIVSDRLGREHAAQTVEDGFLNNWQRINPEKPFTLDNLTTLADPFGLRDVAAFYLLAGPLAEAAFAPAVSPIADITDNLATLSDKALIEALNKITRALKEVTQQFRRISIRGSEQSDTEKDKDRATVDPQILARTFLVFGRKSHQNEQSNSGSDSPVFHLMDALIGKPTETDLSNMMEEKEKSNIMPPTYQLIFDLVKQNAPALKKRILESDSAELRKAHAAMLDAYIGEKGFLAIHLLIATGYIHLAFFSGRTNTNGGSNGAQQAKPLSAIIADNFTQDMELRRKHSGYHELTNTTQKKPLLSRHRSQKIEENIIDPKELLEHCAADERPWIVIDGNVFDITEYRKTHPGGQRLLDTLAGTDATDVTTAVHKLSMVLTMLRTYYVGKLGKTDTQSLSADQMAWLDTAQRCVLLLNNICALAQKRAKNTPEFIKEEHRLRTIASANEMIAGTHTQQFFKTTTKLDDHARFEDIVNELNRLRAFALTQVKELKSPETQPTAFFPASPVNPSSADNKQQGTPKHSVLFYAYALMGVITSVIVYYLSLKKESDIATPTLGM